MFSIDFKSAFFEIRTNLPNDPRIDDIRLENYDFRSGSVIKLKNEGALNLTLSDSGALPLPQALIGRHIIIATDLFINTITNSGVSNFQLLPALLHFGSPENILKGYQIVNVLGLLDAANHESSIGEVLFDTPGEIQIVDYEDLVLSRSRTAGMDLFLLASNPEKLIISGRVMIALLQNMPEDGWGFTTEELETR